MSTKDFFIIVLFFQNCFPKYRKKFKPCNSCAVFFFQRFIPSTNALPNWAFGVALVPLDAPSWQLFFFCIRFVVKPFKNKSTQNTQKKIYK